MYLPRFSYKEDIPEDKDIPIMAHNIGQVEAAKGHRVYGSYFINMFNSQNKTEAELYVETVLMITKYDCRDYFINTTGINTAVMNQFSLCRGIKQVDSDGTVWYKDIHPVTQVNINAESLIDLQKGIEITYQTYY